MIGRRSDLKRFVRAIARSGLTIYDPIEIGDPNLWIPSPELEALLDDGLRGISLGGLPLRTRSKVVKQNVCRVLGYPVPASFKRSKPRFPGQSFDTYTQKSNNLQIWNEELAPSRRYVLIRVSEEHLITRVRVVTGGSLARFDTTGTLTQKYQARCIPGPEPADLIVAHDTAVLRPLVSAAVDLAGVPTPVRHPQAGELLPIAVVFKRLRTLIGAALLHAGDDQERTRGADLHRLVCQTLGYATYHDDGQFPDVRHQLLEVKLQTSATIDLGLVAPNSTEALDVPQVRRQIIRHCDVRYAVFFGRTTGTRISITHLFVTTGEAFFTRFPQFRGKVLNKKLQIPLPSDFFET